MNTKLFFTGFQISHEARLCYMAPGGETAEAPVPESERTTKVNEALADANAGDPSKPKLEIKTHTFKADEKKPPNENSQVFDVYKNGVLQKTVTVDKNATVDQVLDSVERATRLDPTLEAAKRELKAKEDLKGKPPSAARAAMHERPPEQPAEALARGIKVISAYDKQGMFDYDGNVKYLTEKFAKDPNASHTINFQSNPPIDVNIKFDGNQWKIQVQQADTTSYPSGYKTEGGVGSRDLFKGTSDVVKNANDFIRLLFRQPSMRTADEERGEKAAKDAEKEKTVADLTAKINTLPATMPAVRARFEKSIPNAVKNPELQKMIAPLIEKCNALDPAKQAGLEQSVKDGKLAPDFAADAQVADLFKAITGAEGGASKELVADLKMSPEDRVFKEAFMLAIKDFPPNIKASLEGSVPKILANPELKKQVAALGADLAKMSKPETDSLMKALMSGKLDTEEKNEIVITAFGKMQTPEMKGLLATVATDVAKNPSPEDRQEQVKKMLDEARAKYNDPNTKDSEKAFIRDMIMGKLALMGVDTSNEEGLLAPRMDPVFKDKPNPKAVEPNMRKEPAPGKQDWEGLLNRAMGAIRLLGAVMEKIQGVKKKSDSSSSAPGKGPETTSKEPSYKMERSPNQKDKPEPMDAFVSMENIDPAKALAAVKAVPGVADKAKPESGGIMVKGITKDQADKIDAEMVKLRDSAKKSAETSGDVAALKALREKTAAAEKALDAAKLTGDKSAITTKATEAVKAIGEEIAKLAEFKGTDEDLKKENYTTDGKEKWLQALKGAKKNYEGIADRDKNIAKRGEEGKKLMDDTSKVSAIMGTGVKASDVEKVGENRWAIDISGRQDSGDWLQIRFESGTGLWQYGLTAGKESSVSWTDIAPGMANISTGDADGGRQTAALVNNLLAMQREYPVS